MSNEHFTPHGPPMPAWEDPSRSYNHKPVVCQPHHLAVKKRDLSDRKDEKARLTTTCCSAFNQCTQETRFAGFKYIGGSDSGVLRRLFWLFIVLAATCGLLIQLDKSYTKFASRDTNTKLGYVLRDDLDFPSVTFCNINMFRIDQLALYYHGWVGVYYIGIHEIRQLFPEFGLSREAYNQDALDQYDQYRIINGSYPGDQNLYDFIQNSAHLKENMIKLCEYNGERCGSENFTTIITNYGICYTFNSAANKDKLLVNTPGQSQGLSVVLNAEETHVVAAPRENFGFKMLVHPRGEVPNLQDYGIELKTGTHTPVRLDVTEMTSLPPPYGDCGTKPLKYYAGDYTESKCYLECETDYIISQCGCRNFYMPGNATYCSPTQLKDCFYSAVVIFAEERNLICSCPGACHEAIYKSRLSQASFPSIGVATTLIGIGDHKIPAAAFGEAAFESAGGDFYTLYDDIYFNRFGELWWFLANENGTTFNETYAETFSNFIQNLKDDIFGNMQYDLCLDFADTLYDVFKLRLYSMASGSEFFTQKIANISERYLQSGLYKQSLVDAFIDSGEYPSSNNNQEFQDLIDSTYTEYDFENLFYVVLEQIYELSYQLMTEHARIIESSDISKLTTDYMRKNFVHVDVFYGNLKVEEIREQQSYIFFQFICDLGGALGLFFGASILSFVETVDFWFTRADGCCSFSKIEKQETKANVEVQPDVLVVS